VCVCRIYITDVFPLNINACGVIFFYLKGAWIRCFNILILNAFSENLLFKFLFFFFFTSNVKSTLELPIFKEFILN